MSTAVPPSVPGSIVPPSPDDQHIKLLAIFYYVAAGLSLFGACFGLVYVGIGAAMLGAPVETAPGEPSVGAVGGVMIGVGALVLGLSFLSGLLQFLTARYLGQRTHRIFCLVIAGINCLSVPLGTILGIFTIVVLVRPSVIAQFAQTNDPDGPIPATLP
jgi:hypothetical protein